MLCFVVSPIVVGGRKGSACRESSVLRGRPVRRRCRIIRMGMRGEFEEDNNTEQKQKQEGEDDEGRFDAEMEEIDRAADAWVGTDLDRWYWYQGMKARRNSLQRQLERSEEDAEQSLQELRQSLRELELLTGVQFLKGNNEDLTPLSYVFLTALLIGPIFLVYWITSEIINSFAALMTPLGM